MINKTINDQQAMTIALNPDCASDDDLRDLIEWIGHNEHPVRQSHTLWGYRRKHTIAAVIGLKNYCLCTLLARTERRSGDINKALIFEKRAEAIYNDLPEWVKW